MIVADFPFGLRFQEDGKIGTFPVAQGRVKKQRGGQDLYVAFLVDSGATISVLPVSDAEVLRTDISSGKKIIVRGLGATDFVGWQHTLTCMIGTRTFDMPVVFVDHPATPRILGRQGVFEQFLILFDEERRHVTFFDRKARKHILALGDKRV